MTTAQNLSNLGQLFTTNALGYRNKVINGNFDVWQRGISLSVATSAVNSYGPDRWSAYMAGGVSGALNQGVFATGSVPYPTARYCLFFVCNQAPAGSNIRHKIEGVKQFDGQTVTISQYMWASAGAPVIQILLRQNFGTGGSPSASVDVSAVGSVTVGAGVVKYTYTVTLPSMSGKTFGTNGDDCLEIIYINTSAAASTLGLSQVQLEFGNIATVFEQKPYALELLLCQRFYEVFNNQQYLAVSYASGYAGSGGIQYKSTKRAVPVATVSNLSATTLTGIGLYNAYPTTDSCGLIFTTTSSVGAAGVLIFTVTFSADL